MLTDAPRFDTQQAARIARDVFGIDVRAHTLPSERDQNFLLTDASGPRCVLKIANASEQRAILDAQQAALSHVAPEVPVCPRVIPSSNGQRAASVRDDDGREQPQRLLASESDSSHRLPLPGRIALEVPRPR